MKDHFLRVHKRCFNKEDEDALNRMMEAGESIKEELNEEMPEVDVYS